MHKRNQRSTASVQALSVVAGDESLVKNDGNTQLAAMTPKFFI